MRKFWTPREDRYLRTWYPRKGPDHCATQLPNRTRRAVTSRAQRLGLISGQPEGYVPLCWVAPRADGTNALARAVQQAETDGALRRMEGRYTVNLVPVDWADEYVEKLGAQHELADRTQDWYRTKDVAALAGLSTSSFTRNLSSGHGVARYVRGVERVEIAFPQRHYRWEPRQTREAVRKWRASRRRTQAREVRP